MGYLYSSSKNSITSNDGGGSGDNFYIAYSLTAGNTYYIAMKLYGETGTFTFVTKTDCIESTTTVCVTAVNGRKIFITTSNFLPIESEIILACYDGGKLVEIQSTPNKNETIYFTVESNFDSAKVMAWDSLNNMTPLCEAEQV